jgi:hypothetical protein
MIEVIMSTVEEIESLLSNLSTQELHRIERSIHELYRQRNERIVYNDSYGVWTEEDQASAASEAIIVKWLGLSP